MSFEWSQADAAAQNLGYKSFIAMVEEPLINRYIRGELRRYTTTLPMEDLYQEAVIKLAKGIKSFKGLNNAALTSWMTALIRNLCIDLCKGEASYRGKGRLVYENEIRGAMDEEGDGGSFDLSSLASQLEDSATPEGHMLAMERLSRVESALASELASTRQCTVATVLNEFGYPALCWLIAEDKRELVDNTADFIASVLLSATAFDTEELRATAIANLTEELGGKGNTAQMTPELLQELALDYGFGACLDVSQIAILLNRSESNIRVHTCRGVNRVLEKAAPDYLAEVQANRTRRVKKSVEKTETAQAARRGRKALEKLEPMAFAPAFA